MRSRPLSAAAALAAALLFAAACGQRTEENTAHAQQASGDATAAADGTAADLNGTAYDATAQGTAASVPSETGTASPTAEELSRSAADLDLTRRIRQAIMTDDTISLDGKNVSI